MSEIEKFKIEMQKETKIDFKKLRLNMNNIFPNVVTAVPVLTSIPVRKPHRDEFFRVRPGDEWAMDVMLLHKKAEDEKYVVYQEFLPPLMERGLVKPVRFFFLVAWGTGVMFVSEVPLPAADGKYSEYHQSRMLAYEQAKEKWVSISPDKASGCYRVTIASGNLPEPVWATRPGSMEEALDIAFRGKVIDCPDHPILKKLRGEV